MTDITNWRETIHLYGIPAIYPFSGEIRKDEDGIPILSTRMMIPLSQYQMGNLLDALTQAKENGDWWGEFQDIVAAAMEKFGIKELKSNSDKTFTLEQVQNRNIKNDGRKSIKTILEENKI